MARVLGACPITYADDQTDAHGPSPACPRGVGKTHFRKYLDVVQDDANWLVLIDADDAVHTLPLPPRPESGSRIFSRSTGDKNEK